jgi:hypothetical protein
MSGAMVARGEHWHAVGMMTFRHDHLVRRGRPHRHRDAVGQLSGVDSTREPVPAQMREDVASRLTVYPKGNRRQ